MNTAVIYSKLAPFHVARLQHAGKLWNERGSHLTCVEIASEQSSYGWEPSLPSSGEFTRITIFEGRDYCGLSGREVRREINRAFEHIDVDVMVVNGWSSTESLAALGWCTRRGVPRVVISDSQYIDSRRRFWKEAMKRFFLAQCHSGFTGGSPHIRYLESLGFPAKHCVVGCDVIDNELFLPVLRRRLEEHVEEAPSTMELLSCLRLLKIKNVPAVLQALSRVKIPWRWTLAGDGPERGSILKIIRSLGLEDRVVTLGAAPYTSIGGLYDKASVYLQPSLSESWGLAVNEAMASGLPVLVSRQCGCHEDLVLDGVNGYTFDPRSIDDLVSALERMWRRRDEWSEMGLQSSRIIRFWSLDLFSGSLWRACEIAAERAARRVPARPRLAQLWRLV